MDGDSWGAAAGGNCFFYKPYNACNPTASFVFKSVRQFWLFGHPEHTLEFSAYLHFEQ